jgi:hypothetical protein
MQTEHNISYWNCSLDLIDPTYLCLLTWLPTKDICQ